MPKFRARPLPIYAEYYENGTQLNGNEVAPGTWIVTGIHGAKYPITHRLFRKMYEPIDNESR